jgi:hypothetical protein
MEWLSQNWVWLAFAAGMVLMMRRGGAGGCCGGHGANDQRPKATESQSGSASAQSCCGARGHGADGKHSETQSPPRLHPSMSINQEMT